MNTGDTVRITAPGEFFGRRGLVVRITRRAKNAIGVRLPNHPWSNPPETVWWFDKREVEVVH